MLFWNNKAAQFHFWEYMNGNQIFGFSPALHLQCIHKLANPKKWWIKDDVWYIRLYDPLWCFMTCYSFCHRSKIQIILNVPLFWPLLWNVALLLILRYVWIRTHESYHRQQARYTFNYISPYLDTNLPILSHPFPYLATCLPILSHPFLYIAIWLHT